MENSSDPECGMLQQLPDASILESYTEVNISPKDFGMKHQFNLQTDQFAIATGKLKSDYKMF